MGRPYGRSERPGRTYRSCRVRCGAESVRPSWRRAPRGRAVTVTDRGRTALADCFGIDWVEKLHTWSSNLVLALVVVHVLGVLLMCVLQKENLVRAMITGRKRAPEPGDVD